jgi:hypothetical protein
MIYKKHTPGHICLDYREINKITIKDEFSTHIIDYLLNELQGEIFFTKLDHSLGYHQIRMRDEDIPKITFRTHEGNYQFFVMFFGLTNVSSTFQILMNYIFILSYKNTVLVFFDDILITTKLGNSMYNVLTWA